MRVAEGKNAVNVLAAAKEARKEISIMNDRLGFSAPRNLFMLKGT